MSVYKILITSITVRKFEAPDLNNLSDMEKAKVVAPGVKTENVISPQ